VKWLLYVLIFTGAGVLGSTCTWLASRGRTFDAGVLTWMTVCTTWFILTDLQLERADTTNHRVT